MQKRLYFYFYKKFHNTLMANIFSRILHSIFIAYYIIKKFFTPKMIINADYGQAYKTIQNACPKPEMEYNAVNSEIDENIDLSIIIPTYNYEAFLKECVDSVIHQNTKYMYEIIIVDDGSTDKSKAILESYRQIRNIKLISQKNKGLSAARNTGIDIAQGKYLMFVDSDDILNSQTVEKMMNEAHAKNRDIVECGYYNFFNNSNKQKIYKLKPIENVNNYGDLIMNCNGYAWAKIYKRELFNSIRFPTNCWFEDTLIKLIVFRICKSYSYCSEALYGQRMHGENLTTKAQYSVRAVEHYWVLEWLIHLSDQMSLNNEYLYKTLVYHLGPIFASRTIHLQPELRKAVFILGCNLLKEWKPKETYHLPYMFSQLEKSLDEYDYSRWQLVSKYF